MKQEIFNFGKDSLIYGVGTVVTRFIGLLTLPLFTAYLTPEEYGVIAMLALLNMVLQPIFSLGLTAAMGPLYFRINSQENKAQVVWTVFIINLISVSFLVMIVYFFPDIIGRLAFLSDKYYSLIILSILSCGLLMLANSFTQRIQFEKQSKLYVVATFITVLTTISISIFTVVFLEWGIVGMLIGQLASNLVNFILFLYYGTKGLKISLNLNLGKRLIVQGIPLIPGFAFLFILMHGNKYMIETVMGLNAVGIYSIGFNIGMTISVITGAITTAWYPFFMNYQSKQQEANILFGRIFTYYTIGVGLVAMIFFICAKPLIMILLSYDYQQAHIVVGLVASAHYFIGMYSLLLPGLFYKNELWVQSIIQGSSIVASVPVSYYLILHFGIIGAGFGVAISHLFLVFFTKLWNIYRRNTYIKIIYEWKRLIYFLTMYFILAIFNLNNELDSLSSNILLSLTLSCLVIWATIQLLTRSEVSAYPLLRLLKI
jgi:O-antigen/teichoic acid export membrane protein